MKLSSLNLNESGIVTEIKLTGELLSRLNALGVTIGAKIKVQAFSYFNNPIMISLRNYTLALRREIADKIKVERIN